MKKHVALLGLVLLFLSGCVAVPPLITVNHRDAPDGDLRARVDSLELRVHELEQKAEHR